MCRFSCAVLRQWKTQGRWHSATFMQQYIETTTCCRVSKNHSVISGGVRMFFFDVGFKTSYRRSRLVGTLLVPECRRDCYCCFMDSKTLSSYDTREDAKKQYFTKRQGDRVNS